MKKIQKIFAVILCALSILTLAACSSSSKGAYMPNPFTDCKDMAAAAKISGFEMTVPEKVNGYEQSLIQAIQDQMIQVIYGSADNNVYLRKAAKKAFDTKDVLTAVTGDYNSYKYTGSITVGKLQVQFKGASSDKISAAAWSNGDYYYAVTASGCTLSPSAIDTLAKAVK